MRSVLAFAFAGFIASAGAADLNGAWSGIWTKDGDSLPVTMFFEHSPQGETGSFESDALQVTGIPLFEIEQNGTKVHWVVRSDNGTSMFDGVLTGDRLDGGFSENGKTGEFHLKRQSRPAARVTAVDVSFDHDEIALAGTLLRPVGAAKGLRPAIVFVHGSGPEGRWANRYLAGRFSKAGFVTLIYDKRGVGGSTGDWKAAGISDLAADACAAAAFIRSQPGVNPRKIGLYGHSQGGWVGPLAASQDCGIAFLIASSAGGIGMADTEEYSLANSLGVKALPPAEAADAEAFARAIVATAYRGAPYANLEAVAARFENRSWFFTPPPPDNFYWSFARRLARFDPPAVWRRIQVPVLLVYGEDDERIPAEPSRQVIAAALKASGNEKLTTKVFAHADHNFRVVGSTAWPKRAPGYVEALTNWALAIAH